MTYFRLESFFFFFSDFSTPTFGIKKGASATFFFFFSYCQLQPLCNISASNLHSSAKKKRGDDTSHVLLSEIKL